MTPIIVSLKCERQIKKYIVNSFVPVPSLK